MSSRPEAGYSKTQKFLLAGVVAATAALGAYSRNTQHGPSTAAASIESAHPSPVSSYLADHTGSPIPEISSAPPSSPTSTSSETAPSSQPAGSGHGPADIIDASTLDHKFIVGYQGWHQCPTDGSPGAAWRHWFNGGKPSAGPIVDGWPDTSQLTAAEKCDTGLKLPDGQPAYVFSDYNPQTVMRQFKWLQQNGMDGVMLQRFTSELSSTNMFAERNQVAQNVMSAAASTGRTFNIMYDTAGQNPSTLVETVEKDWEYLVDSGKLTESSRYLRQNGLPVVSLYGFDVKTHPGTPTDLRELLTFFKHNANPAYRAYLIGGVSKDWRTNKTWASALGGFDAISPWMVGRFNSLSRADKYKSTTAAELQYAQAHGQKFLAGIFPGFSHYNRKGNQLNKIPRLGGRFLWEQAYNDVSLGVTSLYGAMLDEYNEGTALLPMAATAAYWPSGMKMVPLETDGYTKLPSDWYLRVGGEITKMVAGKIPPTPELPITPH